MARRLQLERIIEIDQRTQAWEYPNAGSTAWELEGGRNSENGVLRTLL